MAAIKIDGTARLVVDLVNHEGKIDKETRNILRKAGVRVRKRQKELVPKRTKLLMRSINMVSRGTKWRRSVQVGPRWSTKYKGQEGSTHYGIFQEFGTARMKAQPFVAPSLQGEAERLTADLNEALKF